MRYIFTQVRVIDRQSPYHNQTVNILVDGDMIVAIGPDVDDEKAKKIAVNGACVSPGWVELHSNFGDPGMEEREDIKTGASAAAAGGFTGVALSPATYPVIQTKADIEYVLNRADDTPINIYPLGALSRDLKGEELTEMYDMQQAGACGFYNDKYPVQNANLLRLALLYGGNMAPIFVHPRQKDLTIGGQMNEGHTSTYLGLKGIPSFAEEIMISRDLFISQYTQTPIHFAGISTAGAVQLIREAKQNGLPITADVNFYNLVLTDDVLKDYDTNYKLNPPLRTAYDCKALIEGLKDGTIDAIAADHVPHDVEHKVCEFDNAAFGMAAIESMFGALHPVINEIGLELVLEKLTIGPRAILKLPAIRIAEGNIAEVTFFRPHEQFMLTKSGSHSKAANNPYISRLITGTVVGIFNKQIFTPTKEFFHGKSR